MFHPWMFTRCSQSWPEATQPVCAEAQDCTLLVDPKAEQVQKCSAAAQNIFTRAERLGGHDFERVLAVFGDEAQSETSSGRKR
jgi:hypothetical protein